MANSGQFYQGQYCCYFLLRQCVLPTSSSPSKWRRPPRNNTQQRSQRRILRGSVLFQYVLCCTPPACCPGLSDAPVFSTSPTSESAVFADFTLVCPPFFSGTLQDRSLRTSTCSADRHRVFNIDCNARTHPHSPASKIAFQDCHRSWCKREKGTIINLLNVFFFFFFFFSVFCFTSGVYHFCLRLPIFIFDFY